MAKNYYVSGQWNVTCDVCSKKIKAHEAKQRWDGFIVCQEDYEQRHPQDFVRARSDKISVPFQRPIQTPNYYLCTVQQAVCIAGVGVAGCMVAGRITGYEK